MLRKNKPPVCERKPSINDHDQEIYSELVKMVRGKWDARHVQDYFKRYPDCLKIEEINLKESVLHLAIKNNNKEMVETILMQSHYNPTIQKLVWYNEGNYFYKFISRGHILACKNKNNLTPIQLAASNQSWPIVILLAKHWQEYQKKNSHKNFWTEVDKIWEKYLNACDDAFNFGDALIIAAANNQYAAVKSILSATHSVRDWYKDGESALHFAAEHVNPEMLLLLRKHKPYLIFEKNGKENTAADIIQQISDENPLKEQCKAALVTTNPGDYLEKLIIDVQIKIAILIAGRSQENASLWSLPKQILEYICEQAFQNDATQERIKQNFTFFSNYLAMENRIKRHPGLAQTQEMLDDWVLIEKPTAMLSLEKK